MLRLAALSFNVPLESLHPHLSSSASSSSPPLPSPISPPPPPPPHHTTPRLSLPPSFSYFSTLLLPPLHPSHPSPSCLRESTASICCGCSSRRRLDFSRQSTPNEVNYASGDASLVRVSDGGGATLQLITHWPAAVYRRQVVHLRSDACSLAFFTLCFSLT